MESTLKIVCKAVESKLGEDIKIIDLRSVSPFIDYFLICSANNQRHANAIIDEVLDKAKENNIDFNIVHNSNESLWLIADLNSVVCHVFVGDERQKYNLEGLWKDLPLIDVNN